MVWIIGALCLILFGAGIGVIGLSLNMLGYAIVGGIMVLAGIFLLLSIWSSMVVIEEQDGPEQGALDMMRARFA